MITAIDLITPINGGTQTQSAASNGSGDSIFASVFRSAIDNVKQTEADVVEAEYLLATGQLDNPATLTIASTKSELAVELLVQLRNKALEAYTQLNQINL